MNETLLQQDPRMPHITESMIQLGAIAVIKEALKSGNSRSLLPVVRQMRALAHSGQLTADVDIFDHLDPMTATNAIAAYAIERAWISQDAFAAELLQASGNKFVQFPSSDHISAVFEEDPASGLSLLEKSVSDVSTRVIGEAVNTSSDEYEALLGARKIPSLNVQSWRDLSGKISTGFITANRVVWGFLRSTAPLYVQQFQQPVTTAELSDMQSSGKEWTILLAALDMGVFTAAVDRLGSRMSSENKVGAFMNLYLEERKGHLEFELRPGALRALAEDIPKLMSAMRTGCPALAAKSADGQNTVANYYEWCKAFSNKYYVPHLERHSQMLLNTQKR